MIYTCTCIYIPIAFCAFTILCSHPCCDIYLDEDRYASEELSKKQKPWLEDPNEGSQTLFKHASAKSVHLFLPHDYLHFL